MTDTIISPVNYTPDSPSSEDIDWITQQLGRAPRGLQGIAVRCKNRIPVVIQVASLVDSKPFPTLFWLVDKPLNYAIDQLEAGGMIAELQQRVDDEPLFGERMESDHHAHIELRHSQLSASVYHQLNTLGFASVLSSRGIGGIENFHRIRCLHTYYAAHLVQPNLVGEWLDEHWQKQGLSFPHLEG